MPRVAIDAMGGDYAPQEIVLGALKALEHSRELEIILVGDKEKIAPLITSSNNNRLSIYHTSQFISGDDDPGLSIRRKKDSSMVKAIELVRSGEAHAVLSAGNTGALMAAGLLFLGRIKNVSRPALLTVFPTFNGGNVVVLDVGANMDAKPENLWQYAIMGKLYAQELLNKDNPRVALLNVGTEENKGNQQIRKTFSLFQDKVPGFIGNVEANAIFQGTTDVLVSDGFIGNIVLKLVEGLSQDIFSALKNELNKNTRAKIGAFMMMPSLKAMKQKLDASEYGGALLIGLKGICIKCHGSSRSKAIQNALLHQVKPLLDGRLKEMIESFFALSK